MFKNALVSVSNKTGLPEFLKKYSDQGMRIVSTGGTAKFLREKGLPIIEVSEQTGFPEVMDGRVRTLHPLIHMPLLARNENQDDVNLLNEYKIDKFDLVIGNLYPYADHMDDEITERELSEYIDIGGPALLRAAAKNYQQITVICDPEDYKWIAEENHISIEKRRSLAGKVFSYISNYDSLIAQKLSGPPLRQQASVFGNELVQTLRYGENPHQDASWLKASGVKWGLHDAKILSGKPLSYNNILDIDAAVGLLRKFKEPSAVIVKHNNPCGVATRTDPVLAIKLALEADPVSVFGGIVAINSKVTIEMAELLSPIFLECIVAPEYTDEALAKLSQKKNLRILEWKDYKKENTYDLRSITGGYLIQTRDQIDNEWNSAWTIIGEAPNNEIKSDLLFAWKVSSNLKSNAICLAANSQTVGLGMGQVNRIDSIQQACERWKKFHVNTKNVVLASDAFFPFSDSVEKAAAVGIKWIIQPGGSVKDEEVFATAKKLSVNIILTHKRHFKH